MHPRNPYRIPPNFLSLAESYEPLKKHLITEGQGGRPTIDFRNDEALRCLTRAILSHDFGLRVQIPNDRLCPPVPNRLNYILWLQDIVTAHDQALASEKRQVRVLDIGTGSTAIYPLLGCKWDETWSFTATELDDESFINARENISRNNLESRVQLRRADLDGSILFPLEDEASQMASHPFTFTMCNPPFYGSRKEIVDAAEDKELPPNAACTGADIEMIYTNGGESGFVGQMVDESLRCQTACRWFTSMLGKLSSLQQVVQRLRENEITNYAITEFVQGQTRRWAIGWSFLDMRLPDSVARIPSIGSSHPLYRILPPRNTLSQPFSKTSSHELWQALIDVLDTVSGVTTTHKKSFSQATGKDPCAALLLVEASGNTWSRSARRKTKNPIATESAGNVHETSYAAQSQGQLQPTPTLTISITFPPTKLDTERETQIDPPPPTLVFQWIYGKERAAFESFVSHITRKVGLAVKHFQESQQS